MKLLLGGGSGSGAYAADVGVTEAATLAAVATLTVPAGVNVVRTASHTSAGRGGAAYRRVGSEPAHPGKAQSADGAWWELAEAVPTPEMFGAVGNGTADDTAALQAAIACVVARGRGTVGFPAFATYGISAPVQNLGNPGVMLDGSGARAGVFGPVTIRKLAGFAGEAAIVWGQNPASGQAAALTGGGIRGLRIDGNAGGAGAGIVIRKVGNASFEDLTVEDNAGHGIVCDGVWQAGFTNCATRKNGGDGFVIENTERKCSDIDFMSCHFSNNDGCQLRIKSHATDIALSPTHLNFFGGICELPRATGALAAQPNPVVEIQACVEVGFFGMNLMQRGAGSSPTEAPALIIGKAGHTLLCEHVAIHGVRIQHDWTALAKAILIANEVGEIVIGEPKLTLGANSKLIDATASTAGIVSIRSAGLARDKITDPNFRVVVFSSKLDVSLATTAGTTLRVAAAGLQLALGKRVGTTWTNGLVVGAGGNGDLVQIPAGGMYLNIAGQADTALPASPVEGTLFYWNGTGTAPDGGANGRGLYVRNNGFWAYAVTPGTMRAAYAADVGPGPFLYGNDAAGSPVEYAMSSPLAATVLDWLVGTGGLTGMGEASARSRLYTALALVGDTAILALPSAASPDLSLSRLIVADRSFMLAAVPPDAALLDRAIVQTLAVKNTSGATITMSLAPMPAAGRAPVYLHPDHAGALPTVLAGETAFFRVAWQDGVPVVQRIARTPNFRRMLPAFVTFAPHGGAAWSFPAGTQKIGDLIVNLDMRQNATPPDLGAGFTEMPTLLSAGHVANHSTHVSWRIAAADDESFTPGANAGGRCLGVLFRDVDPVNPIIANTAWSTAAAPPVTIPALAITEPGLLVPLFVANKTAIDPEVQNLPPTWAETFFHSVGATDFTAWMGGLAGSLSTPVSTVTTNAGTGGGGAVIALRGREIAA